MARLPSRLRAPANRRVRGRRVTIIGITAVGVLAAAAVAVGDLARTEQAGPRPDGTAITSLGWRVTPAGHQLTVGERPYGMALSPDGKRLLVSNDGVGTQSLMSVDTANANITKTIPYDAPQALFSAWRSARTAAPRTRRRARTTWFARTTCPAERRPRAPR